jgi:hypothetical protein
VLAQSPEGLDENAESQAVDPAEAFEVDHHGPGSPAQVIERLAERRRRVGAELAGQRDHGRARCIADLDSEVHRALILLSDLVGVADGVGVEELSRRQTA